jgi:AraC family transcriptional activator of pobA
MELKFVQNDVESDLLVLRKYQQIYDKHRNLVPLINGDVPPTRQTPYWMVLHKKGPGEKSIGQFSFQLKDNTLFIVLRRVMHANKYYSTDRTGYVMVFNMECFLNFSFLKDVSRAGRYLKARVGLTCT